MVDITLRPLSGCAGKHGRVQRKCVKMEDYGK